MSDELPKGWISLGLAEAVEQDALIQYGILQPGPDTPNGIPYVRPTEIRDDCIDEASLRRTTRKIASGYSRSSLKGGDVILSIVGSIGKVAIVPPSLEGANITQSSARLRPRKGLVSSQLLAWFLRSPLARRQFDEAELGTGVPRLNIGDIRTFSMPIAPAAEQRRIVAKVEALLAEVNTSLGNSRKVSAILKRFRQSVLAAGCSGQLTKEWRREKGESDSWRNVRLGDVGSVTGGITKNPKRDSLARKVAYLRVANVYENRLDLTEVLKIGVTSDEYRRTVLQRGDLLFVEGNGSIDQIGRVAIWDGSIPHCVHQNHLIRFRASERVLPQYALIWMMAPQGRQQLTDQAVSSAGLHSLSISKVAAVEFELTSLEEQREIVRCVDALFALAATIEKQVTAATGRADRLTQSILAKAFRGELVPTEAELAHKENRDYESASELLERIREGRAFEKTPKR